MAERVESFMPEQTPTPRTQFESRQLIEALRVGVASAHQQGGSVQVVIGDYGFGKSHLAELTGQEALSRQFWVATTSLDLQEVPSYKAFDIYASLINN